MRLSGDAGRPSTQNHGVKKRHLGERARKLHYAGDIFGAGKQSTTQEEFSVRVNEGDAANLDSILKHISTEQVKAMQVSPRTYSGEKGCES